MTSDDDTSPEPSTAIVGPLTSTDDDIIDAEIVPDEVPARPDLTLPPPPAFDYTDAGVPTLDYVRDRIEGKLAVAQGQEELADQQVQQRQRAADERERLAAEKLAEIRRSLRD